MAVEKRHPGWLKLGLVDQRGQVLATTPLEFHDEVLKKLRVKLPGLVLHTRGEIVRAVEAAYQEVAMELKQRSIQL